MQLAQVILFAKDVAKLRAFYESALGLSYLDGEAGFVRLDAGGCALALHAIPPAIAARIEIRSPPIERGDTPIKLAFRAADVDAARATAIACGAVMKEVRRFDGITLCDGVDPEGNVFQITTR